jgi:hypothetical protein
MSEDGVWILTSVGGRFTGAFSTAEVAMQHHKGEWTTVGMNRYQLITHNLHGTKEVYILYWWKLDNNEGLWDD